MTRAGVPIAQHPLSEALNTGIVYGVLVPGVASQYEEREAAVFSHYNWTHWRELDWRDRAEAMAHFRLHRMVELHQNDVVAREVKRRSKPNPGA